VAVHPIVRILMGQQAAQFADLRGAQASASVPISERLLNEIIQQSLPGSVPVRELRVAPRAGDKFVLRARVGTSPLIPALSVTAHIDRQPDLPASPVLVLRLEMGALMSLAGPALRFFDALPRGIKVDRDRVHVDLARLLADRGLASYLEFLQTLEVHTVEGAVVIDLRASIPRQ
jgi:hypothetical protein